MFKKIFSYTLVLSLLACSPNLTFSVKERWSKSIRNFALQPVYPMREDVFVGTLRLVVDECPSSYKMGHQSGLSIGGSGSLL